MGTQVCTSATIQCSMGTGPAALIATPSTKTKTTEQTAATVNDYQPLENVPSFIMCMSLSNPSVSAATAAAQGVLTPMPCIPNTTSPWTPGASKVTLGGNAALDDSSTLTCAWGGTIQINSAGQQKVDIE
jgi:hypothetical protein